MRSLGENTGAAQTFGAYLREQREAKGFSLRRFAQMVGIAPSYESNIESSTAAPPSPEVISKMAQVLGLRESLLLVRAGKLHASTWRWFWSQPIVQETLGCASGMTEADARMYVLTAFPELAGYQGEQTA
jgi:transcriptional regulator with XRE-family HTH domain